MRTAPILTVLSLLALTSYASPIPPEASLDLSARDISLRDTNTVNSNASSGSGNPHHGKLLPDKRSSEPVDLNERKISLRDTEIVQSNASSGSGNPHHDTLDPDRKRADLTNANTAGSGSGLPPPRRGEDVSTASRSILKRLITRYLGARDDRIGNPSRSVSSTTTNLRREEFVRSANDTGSPFGGGGSGSSGSGNPHH
ncbi:hypothetical protein UCRPC4_g01894 [Phaeomoniella chlamydospora]|uniref:Uncharacterized protein n=1 Tax=Phaeomoniella chlamydospora TaxID=158046 RepID=A0A0G2GPS0_PHACM|nr:hypothetical protein UCRPC4_g01894 [Phaeomoniella chlamydospora]